MTTSLPTTCSETPLAPAGANASAASMLGAFAALFAAPAGSNTANAMPGTASVACSPTFESLLAPVASGTSAAEAAVSSVKHASPHAAVPSAIAAVRSQLSSPCVATEPSDAAKVRCDDSTEMPLDRATLEAALTLLAGMVAPVSGVAPQPSEPALEGGAPGANNECDASTTEQSSSPQSAPAVVRVSVSTSNGTAEFEVAMPGVASTQPGRGADSASTRLPLDVPATGSTAERATLAPETAVAAKVGLSALPATSTTASRHAVDAAPEGATASNDAEPQLLVQAELEVQPGVRMVTEFAVAPSRRAAAATPGRAGEICAEMTVEKNAAEIGSGRAGDGAGQRDGEKTFLNAGSSEVALPVHKAGIAVAQERTDMSAALPSSNPTAASVRPAAALERAAEPARSAPADTAQRAVDTVVSLVHAQAVSKMQPVPSVQLRFKVGHEDLAVRVELRDGEVHTEFRTENAELRAAVAQEWRAVTAKPDAVMRFLDPVFSSGANSNPGANGQGGSASQQNPQHSHAQQQQYRSQMELFGSVRRAFPAAAPAIELAPVTPLSTAATHRLSAVA